MNNFLNRLFGGLRKKLFVRLCVTKVVLCHSSDVHDEISEVRRRNDGT